MYCTMRVVAIMMDDVIPLYFSSPVDAGGLAFGTQDIGLTLILNGASLMTFQLFVFYRLERRWGCVRCYTYGLKLLFCFVSVLVLMTSPLSFPLPPSSWQAPTRPFPSCFCIRL
jgi:hypothetical protein